VQLVDRRSFLEAPVGRSTVGSTWLYFYPSLDVCGFALWGRPTEDDMEQLVRVLAVELGSEPHVSLVDVRRMEGVGPGAFEALARYVAENHEALSRAVTRLAIVRSQSMMGALASGFFGVRAPPYPVETFDTAEQALAWLGVGRPGVAEELAGAIDGATGSAPIVREVRAWLQSRLVSPSSADCAQALGLSERSLQRKLSEQGTTFQTEVVAARMRAAERLLLETDAQLTRIALDVGCASLPAFSSLFRKATGESPSAWRAKRRAKT
jgi:AraC-like DNA-binding protein